MNSPALVKLLHEVRTCHHCEPELPLGAKPLIIAHTNARILIAGQAPAQAGHHSGIPWNDISGKRLRQWLELSDTEFYDPEKIAIIPMGFCYPGTGKTGDNPPRPECQQLWHPRILPLLPRLQLRIIIGQYAQHYHLKGNTRKNLTETVAAWQDFAPEIYPLPHPSPRNQIWLKRNPWFTETLLPELKTRVRHILTQT